MHILAVLVAATVSAAGGPDRSTGLEVGVRTGLGIATGQLLDYRLDGASDLPRLDRRVPLWLEAGYRLSPSVVVGAYFQYALGRVEPSVCPTGTICSYDGHDLRAGAELHYRFLPEAKLVPWFGVGAGYVSRSVNGTLRLAVQGVVATHATVSATSSGLDASLQAGADARLNPWFALGPYCSGFSGESAGAEAGVRGTFSL